MFGNQSDPHPYPAQRVNIHQKGQDDPQTKPDPLIVSGRSESGECGEQEQEIQPRHQHHRPEELPPQPEHLPTQNLPNAQRCGEQQLERASAMVRPQPQASLRGHPEFERHVQDDRGKNIRHFIQPIFTPSQCAPEPHARPQTERGPDQRRFEPMPATEPQTRIDVEQPGAKGQPLCGVAIGPLLPTLLPAREHSPGGFVLPGIAHGNAGQREQGPADSVNHQH